MKIPKRKRDMLKIHAERKGKKVMLPDEEFSFLIRKVLEIQPLEVIEQNDSSTLAERRERPKSSRRRTYSLEELIEGAVETEEELDWGKPVGSEIW